MNQVVPTSDAVGTIKQALASTKNFLVDFAEINGAKPYQKLEDVIKEMESHCNGISRETASLIAEVKTLTMTATDKYKSSTMKIDAWCGTASQLLEAYMNPFNESFLRKIFRFNDEKAKAKRDILIKVLSNGLEEMNAALDTLKNCSESFDQAAGKLTVLRNELHLAFGERWKRLQSTFFESQISLLATGAAFIIAGEAIAVACIVVAGCHIGGATQLLTKLVSYKKMFKDLTGNVTNASIELNGIKEMFLDEMSIIEDLKAQIDATNFMLSKETLHEEVFPLIKELIRQCNEYRNRKKHSKNF